MGAIEEKLYQMGLTLPAPMRLPGGMKLPFPWVRVRGNLAYISGHGPQNEDGSVALPLGKVGTDVTVQQAYILARQTGMGMLGSLHRALGGLDRIQAWLRVFGMVNSASGFNQQPLVINGFSDLILEVFGEEVGSHARSAVGMAELPVGIAVEVEALVEISV